MFLDNFCSILVGKNIKKHEKSLKFQQNRHGKHYLGDGSLLMFFWLFSCLVSGRSPGLFFDDFGSNFAIVGGRFLRALLPASPHEKCRFHGHFMAVFYLIKRLFDHHFGALFDHHFGVFLTHPQGHFCSILVLGDGFGSMGVYGGSMGGLFGPLWGGLWGVLGGSFWTPWGHF
jgi:hypothetical protein